MAVFKGIPPEEPKKMEGFKELPPEELEKISGGVLIMDGECYYIVSDDGKLLKPASLKLKEAKKMARQLGWSDELLSSKEFEKRFGREYFEDDYWYQNDQGFYEYDDTPWV